MPYELGLTHVKIGLRLGERDHFVKAEVILARIGAEMESKHTMVDEYQGVSSAIEIPERKSKGSPCRRALRPDSGGAPPGGLLYGCLCG